MFRRKSELAAQYAERAQNRLGRGKRRVSCQLSEAHGDHFLRRVFRQKHEDIADWASRIAVELSNLLDITSQQSHLDDRMVAARTLRGRLRLTAT